MSSEEKRALQELKEMSKVMTKNYGNDIQQWLQLLFYSMSVV